MTRFTFSRVALLVTASLAGCGGDAPISSPEDLRAVLASARAGERICLTEGTFEGSFDVPAGIVLCGAGVGLTRIVGPPGQPTLRVTPSDVARTTITELSVESAGAYGILAEGRGYVDVIRVEVRVRDTGGGIMATTLSALRLTDVDVAGPVMASNANDAIDGGVDLAPAYGVVVTSVASAQGLNLNVSGFSQSGVVSDHSNLALSESQISSNIGIGLVVFGGTAEVTGTVVTTTLVGPRPTFPYNAIFSGGADVTTNGLEVSASEGYGILQSEATATHQDLLAADNANAALWTQNSGGMSITNAMIRDNVLAGVIAVESVGIALDQVDVIGTLEQLVVAGSTPIVVGDGIQLVGVTTDVTMQNVRLSNNARVGMLLDLEGGSFNAVDLRSIAVDGTGAQLGAIAQNGTIPVDWDVNITRTAPVAANDAAFTGTLGTVRVPSPAVP